MMNLRKLVLIIISVLLCTSFAYAQLTTSQVVKKYSPSVVTIVALDPNDQPLSLGSGFFINAGGDIASNHHLLEGSAKAIIKTMDGRKGEILEVINDDPELDVLIARTSIKDTNPVPLGDSDTITVGEEVIAIGNPAGLEGTVSNGIVSGIRKVEGFKFIQITAPISPGSSGGPVFNSTGKVIGIATAYLDFGQNLNFAMPINYLKSLKSSRIKLGSLPKRTPKARTVNREEKSTDVRVQDNGWLRILDYFPEPNLLWEGRKKSEEERITGIGSLISRRFYVKVQFLQQCKAETLLADKMDKASSKYESDKYSALAMYLLVIGSEKISEKAKLEMREQLTKTYPDADEIITDSLMPKFKCGNYRTTVFVTFYNSLGVEVKTYNEIPRGGWSYGKDKYKTEILPGETENVMFLIPDGATSWDVWLPK